MRVPPSFTNSPATPCGLPSWFTRARNAGGNAYSRPQSSPTMCMATPKVVFDSRLVDRVRRALARLDHPAPGLGDDVAHHGFEVAGLAKDPQLAFRAGALAQDGLHVVDGAAASEFVHHVVDQLQQLGNQPLHRHFLFLAEVDQLALDPVPRGAPLVLF